MTTKIQTTLARLQAVIERTQCDIAYELEQLQRAAGTELTRYEADKRQVPPVLCFIENHLAEVKKLVEHEQECLRARLLLRDLL